MECTEISRKEKQNSARRKKFHDHGTRKGYKTSDKVTNIQPDTITYSNITSILLILLIIKHKSKTI